MRPDGCAIASLVAADEGEVTGFDIGPDSLVPLFRLKCVMKVAERNEVAWRMCSSFCDWLHVVNMQFKSRWTSRDLASGVVFANDDSSKVFPERWIPWPVIKDPQNCVIAF